MLQKLLSPTLRLIAIVQFVLGVGFALAPEASAHWLGLSPAPGWANWLLGMMGAEKTARCPCWFFLADSSFCLPH